MGFIHTLLFTTLNFVKQKSQIPLRKILLHDVSLLNDAVCDCEINNTRLSKVYSTRNQQRGVRSLATIVSYCSRSRKQFWWHTVVGQKC